MLHKAVEDVHVQTQEADRIRASLILKLSRLPNSLERELQTRGHFLSLSLSSSPTLFNVADDLEVNVHFIFDYFMEN